MNIGQSFEYPDFRLEVVENVLTGESRLMGAVWPNPPTEDDPPEEVESWVKMARTAEQEAFDSLVDSRGYLARTYEPLVGDHLRIYGLDNIPKHLCRERLANHPPTDFHWGTLGLTCVKITGATDKGDILTEEFYSGETLVCSLSNKIEDTSDSKLKSATPTWYTNDGSAVVGSPPPKPKSYTGKNLNAWKRNARETTEALLMEAIPATLAHEKVFASLEICQYEARKWLALGYGDLWPVYVKYGGKDSFFARFEADDTDWLSTPVSPSVVPGAKPGATIRTLIEDALP